MEAKALVLTCTAPLPPASSFQRTRFTSTSTSTSTSSSSKPNSYHRLVLRKNKSTQEQDLDGHHSKGAKEPKELIDGLPKEYYDEEWQARQREKTKELQRQREAEEEEENRKIEEYREIGMRLKEYPEEEVREARRLVSSFIKSAEEVEEKIEEAAEKGELTELVLMVIWNRLDLARHDDEKDAIRSLDLLYRRVETEILKREASPAMRLLNDLLNLHDGSDEEEWLKQCRKLMADTFPREDPFSILVPEGFDINTHQGQLRAPPPDTDDALLRVDFVKEVDALLQEVRPEYDEAQIAQGLDPESIANRLKFQEKLRAIREVEALLDLAITLQW